MAADKIFLGALPNRAPSDAFKLWEKTQKVIEKVWIRPKFSVLDVTSSAFLFHLFVSCRILKRLLRVN